MSFYSHRSPFIGLGTLVRAFDTSPDAVRIDDMEGTALYINESWSLLFGIEGSRAVDTHWEHSVPPGVDLEELRESWNRCIAAGQSTGEVRFVQADGIEATASYSRTLFRDSEGKPTAVITIYRGWHIPSAE